MFLDIKGKPKKVIIQKCTRAGKWVDEGAYRDLDGLTFEKCVALLRMKNSESFGEYRLIIRGMKSGREVQVLSWKTLDFRYTIKQLQSCKGMHLMADGMKMFASNENPYTLPVDKLIDWIRQSGGLKKTKIRRPSKEDGRLCTFDVTFGDDSKHTFSVFYSNPIAEV